MNFLANICFYEKLASIFCRLSGKFSSGFLFAWWRRSGETHNDVYKRAHEDCLGEIEKSACTFAELFGEQEEKKTLNLFKQGREWRERGMRILLIAFESFIKLGMFAVCSGRRQVFIYITTKARKVFLLVDVSRLRSLFSFFLFFVFASTVITR